MKCIRCCHANADEAQFCSRCGAKLDMTACFTHQGSKLERNTSETSGAPSNTGYLESLLASHAITEKQATRILNEWSLKRPKYLSPLCEHAKLERVRNLWAIHVTMEILVEDRTLKYRTSPYLSDIHGQIGPFKEDIWSIPCQPPDSFMEKTHSHHVSIPDEIALCKKCNGTGQWICPACRGKKEVMCLECEGTGMYKFSQGTFASDTKCHYCHGAKKRPCITCRGADPHPCDNCGMTGKIALFPVVEVQFRVDKKRGNFSQSGVEWDVSNFSGVLLDQSIAPGSKIPVIPEFIPVTVRREIEAVSEKMFQEVAGRIHRTGMSFFLVPFAECHLTYDGNPFTMLITGIKKGVLTTSWVPSNRRRASAFYIGIPSASLFIGGVIASSVLTGDGILKPATGALLIVGTSLGVLSSLGYMLWALLCKPKPKKK